MTNQIKEKTSLILEEIKKAGSILLHCHPSPDPDSVGSALAFKFALEQLGKKATVIRGDSEIPKAFMHFPGANEILMKSYWDIDPNQYDLFIIGDSDLGGVSRVKSITELPSTMTVVNIDHHKTNKGCGHINLIDPNYPASAQLLYDLFTEMNLNITKEIAVNLFMGIYTDTGGFKYEGINTQTFNVAGKLIAIYPEMYKVISQMEISNTVKDLIFRGLVFDSLESVCEGKILMSVVPLVKIKEKEIPEASLSAGSVSPILRTVAGFDLFIVIIEAQPNKSRVSLRTNDSEKYDVSLLASAFGGGGHRAASGVVMNYPPAEARELLINKAKELYNL